MADVFSIPSIGKTFEDIRVEGVVKQTGMNGYEGIFGLQPDHFETKEGN